MAKLRLSKKAEDFLSRRLNGKLASIRKDGSPHVTPMWYAREGSKFILNSTAERVKTRNIERNPRVQLLIDDGEDYVLIEGKASVSKERDGLRDAEMLAIRYEGRAKAQKMVKDIWSKQHRVTIIIEPEKAIERFQG